MSSPAPRARTRLSAYDNTWYRPGRGTLVRALWVVASGLFLQTWLPWPSRLKVALLRTFGARIGRGVVVKPRVTVKYPWHVEVGDDAWIGEGVWLDSLASIRIGADACLSQGCMIETGSHDCFVDTFDLDPPTIPSVDDDPVGAWRALDARFQSALDDPEIATRERETPMGSVTFAHAVDMIATTDILVHTWDLARATGLDETLDPDEVAGLLAGMEPMDEALRTSGHYGPRVEIADDADEQSKLLAFLGRHP
jgi:putative colanic acid biosynthesis acetyltransferase WcaF